jgi:SAM-dependent methyltransferase
MGGFFMTELDREFIARHWYADVYEQFENQTNDVEFFLTLLREQTGGTPQNILEVACGGGRISIPLAQAGHKVTGFDADEHMLLRCYRRMKGIPNIRCYKADAVFSDWGGGFDVVVMAGNVLINIESEEDYEAAQRTFSHKAALALKTGGHLLLDFDLHTDASARAVFNGIRESSYFNGTDDMGTTGRTVGYGGVYDPVTRICVGVGHIELTANNGERFIYNQGPWHKHIPTKEMVYGWLNDAGLTVEKSFRNYSAEPLREPEDGYVKATLWARKD